MQNTELSETLLNQGYFLQLLKKKIKREIKCVGAEHTENKQHRKVMKNVD